MNAYTTATPLDQILCVLQIWRNMDHADKIEMSRHDVITIIEGVKVLRSALDPLARSADTAVTLMKQFYPGEAASLNAHVAVARVALGHNHPLRG